MELTAGEVKLIGRKACRCFCGGSWAPGSWFPCGALNEVITSINSGIDQLGEPWRGDAVSDPALCPSQVLSPPTASYSASYSVSLLETVPVPSTFLFMGKHHFVISPQSPKAGTMLTSAFLRFPCPLAPCQQY